MKKLVAIGITLFALLVSTAFVPCHGGGVPLVALRSPYFNNLEADTHVPATIQGGAISCYVAVNHTLRCVVPNKYVEQYVTIKVKVDGIFINFYVYVNDPGRQVCAV